jgi:protein-L-isoaspartate O-methyltransferase
MTSDFSSTSDADAVAKAVRAIPAIVYLGPDADPVRPVVAVHATVRQLRALDLRPGMRVLEISTGSGYPAALMGHLVGPGGHVLTIDADEDRARRAGALFAAHGHRAVAVAGDGLSGHPGRAPYDRIRVAATPAAIPAAWLDQLAPDGVLVTGCLVSDLPGTYAVAHIVKGSGGPRVTVHAGGYAPLGPPAIRPTVTVVKGQDSSRYYLASSSPNRATAEQFLAIFRTGHAEPWPGTAGEFAHLKNWLLAMRPRGLFTAATELGEGIGIAFKATDDVGHAGTPEVAMVTSTHFVARPAGSPTAARLAGLMHDWRAEGYPATEDLDAVLLRDGDVYRVRIDD